MRDKDSPIGGHHIHCYLLAPRRHKLDGYWHVIIHSLYYVQSLALRPLNYSFGAGHINYNNKPLPGSQEYTEIRRLCLI